MIKVSQNWPDVYSNELISITIISSCVMISILYLMAEIQFEYNFKKQNAKMQ